jgi:hypothetical protein
VTDSRLCEFGRRAVVTSLILASADAVAAAGYAVGEATVNPANDNTTPPIDATSATDIGNATLKIVYDIDVHDGADIHDGHQNSSLHIQKLSNSQSRTSQMTKKINCYSFALKPEEHQPSGTCNFSRIDTAHLETGSALASADNIYAVNYNVLRIMSGMGGLAYSN